MKPAIDRSTLEAVFDAAWSPDELPNHAELRDKFVFHLQDALPDVVKLAELLRSSESNSVDAMEKALYDFFLHAVPHFVAAGQIYDIIPETFPEQKGVHRLEEREPSTTPSR